MGVLTFDNPPLETEFAPAKPITVLICSECGRVSADVAKVPSAWDGWRVSSPRVCHECIVKKEGK